MIYIVEILQPEYRGAFLSLTSVFEIFGSLVIYLVEYYLSAKIVSLLLSINSLFLLIAIFFMPETPYWYMLKKKKDEAIKSLYWLRNGNKKKIDFEIEEIEKNLDSVNKNVLTFMETVFNIKWWNTFLLFSVYIMLIQLTGFDMIIPYAVQFFEKFNKTQIDNRIISIIFMTIAFIGTIVTTFIVEKFKRTSLVKYSNLANVILLIISGMSMKYFHSSASSVLSLLCFCFYGTTVSIVAYGMPCTIISECLPTESRATIFSALGSEFTITYFIIVLIFPTVLVNISIDYIIYLLAFFSLLNYIFVHCFIKETKGIILPGNGNS